MGIVALFVFLVGAAIFTVIVGPLAWLFSWILVRLVFKKSRVLMAIAAVTIFVAAIPLVWYFFNADKIAQAHAMAEVSKDCGWTEFGTAHNVEGIFVEEDGSVNLHYPRTFANLYPAAEWMKRPGEYSLAIFGENYLSRNYRISNRTLRYGIRSKFELVKLNVVRTTDLLLDLDRGEVLAKNIEYSYKPDNRPLYGDALFLFFLPYVPDGECTLDPDSIKARITQVFQPKEELSPEDIARIIGPSGELIQ